MAVSNTPLYQPSPPQIAPQTEDGRNLAVWVQQQLEIIANAVNTISRLQLTPISKAPVTPRDGLISFADGVNWIPTRAAKTLVVYRDGGWNQAELGQAWVALDDGLLQGISSADNRPAVDMVNNANDATGAQVVAGKSRGGANSQTGDNLLNFFGYGTVSGVHQPAAGILFLQAGANSGNNIPSEIVFQTSDTAGQLDHNMVFDNGGNLTLAGILAAGFAILSVGTLSGTSGTLPIKQFITITPSAAFTLTLPAFSSGSWVLLRNVANFAISSASANVIPLAGGAATTAILPATAGKWALLTTDGSGTWTIMAAN